MTLDEPRRAIQGSRGQTRTPTARALGRASQNENNNDEGDEERHENYLCVHVKNVPGILGKVASCLGRHGVSVKQVKQDPRGPGLPVDMVIITERIEDAKVRAAIAEIDAFEDVAGETHRFRLVDRDPTD